ALGHVVDADRDLQVVHRLLEERCEKHAPFLVFLVLLKTVVRLLLHRLDERVGALGGGRVRLVPHRDAPPPDVPRPSRPPRRAHAAAHTRSRNRGTARCIPPAYAAGPASTRAAAIASRSAARASPLARASSTARRPRSV